MEGTIPLKSYNQSLAIYFIMDAKYVACYKATYHTIWLKFLS